MASRTAVELGADMCALARTVVRRGEVQLLAAETLDPGAFPGIDAFTSAVRQTRKTLKLPRRCRAVVWGLPDGSNRKDPSIKPLLAPLIGAGFHVEQAVSPCNALAALARLRLPRGDGATCWLAINRTGVAMVVVRPGKQLYSHSFAWDSNVGSSGSQARLLQRYSLVAFLAPEIRRAMGVAREKGTSIDAIVTCGNLPEIRSLTMPLIEELDVEVESLDSLEGLIVKPDAVERLTDVAASLRIACAGAISRPTRRWDESKRRTGRALLAVTGAAGVIAAALGLTWTSWVGYVRPTPAATTPAKTSPPPRPTANPPAMSAVPRAAPSNPPSAGTPPRQAASNPPAVHAAGTPAASNPPPASAAKPAPSNPPPVSTALKPAPSNPPPMSTAPKPAPPNPPPSNPPPASAAAKPAPSSPPPASAAVKPAPSTPPPASTAVKPAANPPPVSSAPKPAASNPAQVNVPAKPPMPKTQAPIPMPKPPAVNGAQTNARAAAPPSGPAPLNPPPRRADTSDAAQVRASATASDERKPAAAKPAESKPAQPKPAPMPELLKDPVPRVTAILVSSDRRIATVDDGRIIGVGDIVGKRTVVGIDERTVVLREPSGVQIRVALGGRIVGVERSER